MGADWQSLDSYLRPIPGRGSEISPDDRTCCLFCGSIGYHSALVSKEKISGQKTGESYHGVYPFSRYGVQRDWTNSGRKLFARGRL